MPDGKLLCARNGQGYKWYKSDGHNKIYIPKKEEKYASKLAEKKYLSYMLEDLICERNALQMYLRHHHPEPGKAEQLLLDDPECRRLVSKNHISRSKYIKQWLEEPYNTNPYNKEKLICRGSSDNLYRSKSESIIDICLNKYNIPFRYECELVLPTGIIYPDFTILHPTTLKIYYYEHFGMMDVESYAKNACEKIKVYCQNNIYPNVDLLMTFETKERQLFGVDVEKLIKEYFL